MKSIYQRLNPVLIVIVALCLAIMPMRHDSELWGRYWDLGCPFHFVTLECGMSMIDGVITDTIPDWRLFLDGNGAPILIGIFINVLFWFLIIKLVIWCCRQMGKKKTKRPNYVPLSPCEKLLGEEDDVPLFVHVLPSVIVVHMLFFIPWIFVFFGPLIVDYTNPFYVADLVLPRAWHMNDDYPNDCLGVVNIERLDNKVQIYCQYLNSPQEIVERLEQEKKKGSVKFPHSEFTLCIRCDENDPFYVVMEMLDCAKAAGISHVIFGVSDLSPISPARRLKKNDIGWLFEGCDRIPESGFEMDLMAVKPSSESAIELGITEDGEILHGTDIIGAPDDERLDDLVKTLKSAAEKDKSQPIVIRCDRGVAYHRFIHVLDACAAAGMKNISVETFPQNKREQK